MQEKARRGMRGFGNPDGSEISLKTDKNLVFKNQKSMQLMK